MRMPRWSSCERPVSCVGFAILELSKLHMYKFHYEHMVASYTKNGVCGAKLLFMDTDSLCYEVTTPDIYADMLKNASFYDTSNYDKTHPNFSTLNAKIVGKMKDECGGIMPVEFVGLRDR